jgi:hypothetical protein
MARNVVRRDGGTGNTSDELVKAPTQAGSKTPDGNAVATPAMLGGTSGMLDDPNTPMAQIGREIVPAREQKETARVPQRRFQVISGPFQVLYGGVMTKMIPGKVYNEGTVDLDLLRSQGVKLEEIVDQAPVAALTG